MKKEFSEQQFQNEYQFINGVEMHADNPENFLIPPQVIKKQITIHQYVELRIDSPRFSVHQEDADKCSCPSCNGEMSKPILRHSHPSSLVDLPDEKVPSRGWGEDFWVKTTKREGEFFCGVVDNALAESRLHGIKQGDTVFFHLDHVLAVHDVHRRELVSSMSVEDLKELAGWLRLNGPQQDQSSGTKDPLA